MMEGKGSHHSTNAGIPYSINFFGSHKKVLKCLVSSISLIGHFRKYHSTLCLAPKFFISIVFVFSSDHCKLQEKLETMFTQNLGGQTKSVMVFSEVAYSISDCLF